MAQDRLEATLQGSVKAFSKEGFQYKRSRESAVWWLVSRGRPGSKPRSATGPKRQAVPALDDHECGGRKMSRNPGTKEVRKRSFLRYDGR